MNNTCSKEFLYQAGDFFAKAHLLTIGDRQVNVPVAYERNASTPAPPAASVQ